jgi:hypothetical protein
MSRPAVAPARTDTRREAFVEWQQRFGKEGTSALRTLDEVKDERGVIGGDDLRLYRARTGRTRCELAFCHWGAGSGAWLFACCT